MKNTTLASYLENLISEKGVDFEKPLVEFEKVGHQGLSYKSLADFSAEMPIQIQEDIRKNLTVLDFNNADVFDYLNHLINGMIVATGMNQYGGFVETKFGEVVLK